MFVALKYSDISGLERSIDAAYSLASQRLFDVYIEKFKLLDHLNALKDYLLLGHGDFADQLMLALGYAVTGFPFSFSYVPNFFTGRVYRNLPTLFSGTTLLPRWKQPYGRRMHKATPRTCFGV